MTAPLLRLAALDAEDLAVLSAHAQDAVAKLSDVRWSARERRVTVEMNRFAWEAGRRTNERRRSVLQFDCVDRLRAAGASPADRDQVVAILALLHEPLEPPAGIVTIVCSGDVTFRLDVDCIEVRLADVGAVWAAGMRPKHVLP